ncbi:MAG: chromosomal replication initiator protein DnaA [Candidatus Omnitrophica bacterium]|nr:chromosomal replication initiator protein DnaA [Candidatus Omnitrophota bacterium]MBU1133755.1 chromosomal replication initiator protein DnaA [Candidatus Omnitrophota bacterium]MBU1367236.1 chromosomal replication initiator protein DnaA [Candidatus Omnitrophota bacterium]MBU1523045.1 chromosomal replication initiator protein DnaA [Candidatus Omnitrophota bacterium]MBU2436542.1 chromosomal replication initiator protein DnaA [Candidatus Omnitrophota bacterium]
MEKTWQTFREEFKKTLGEISFDTWIAPLNLKKMDALSLTLEAPDEFFKNWVETNYLTQIKQAVKNITQKDFEVVFEVNPVLLKKKTDKLFKTIQRNFQEEPQDSLRLNPRFTFTNFVVGASNRLAHAASLAVVSAPGKSYNPLFIYGGVGLGKTHLMQAIAHHISSKNPKAKVKYTSSEKFTNELIGSIQHRATEKFRQKYRNIDALLVDDIQFLAGKEASQEEFFHTFNTLYDYHKQIVISSDRPPREISKLEERLVSRFSWGLVVDIALPDFETRVAILKKKLEKDPIKIAEDVIFFIAKNITTNIRELEGALIRIIAYSLIEDKPIDLELAKDILKDMVREIYKRITPGVVLEKVGDYFNISKENLKRGKRNKNIVFPRQVAMYLVRELTELSLPEIGNFWGAKHHTTILYAHKKIKQGIEKDEKLKLVINELTQEIKSL